MLTLLLALSVGAVLCDDPTVTIRNGDLKGVWEQSTKGRRYASFWGIPYAQPPVGKYRFREPQPVESWPGVWDASRPQSHCLQYDPMAVAIVGNEDCLFLNVFTPNLAPEVTLPVIVYIHSGAFMFGAGSLYGAAHLMDKDLVVVTFNYRLGALGFLSTGDSVVSGNAGLKDQAAALRWVQQNIDRFGGDPRSVTLTGCSAGSASVHYQILSPSNGVTFHRAIAFSGSAFNPWAYATNPAKSAKTLARLVGCPISPSTELARCLRTRPGHAIVNGMIQMFDWKVHMFIPFLPTMEASDCQEPFISDYPYYAAQMGATRPVPLIATMTAAEGLYPAAYYQRDQSMIDEIRERWNVLASDLFTYNDTAPMRLQSGIARRIKEEYFEDKPVSQETFPLLVKALGDRQFKDGIGEFARIHATTWGQPTYMYEYNYRGEHSLSNHIANNKDDYGVSHADDIMEIFQFLWNSTRLEDVQMREALIDMVYSFASTGEPQFPNCPKWLPVAPGADKLNVLLINGPSKCKMIGVADMGRHSFWNSLGLKEYENHRDLKRDEL